MKNKWLMFVALAGLSWGTYIPLVAYGGAELGEKVPSRLLAVLCLGVAYFLIGVLYPAFYLLRLPATDRPERSFTGLVFSGLAGAAGALGAICVIFATSAAVKAAGGSGDYKLFIAPLIFGLAPVINTLVSTVWHPRKSQPLHFGWHSPNRLLWVGILMVGLGAALVLYSKGLAEAKPVAAKAANTKAAEAKAPASVGETLAEGYAGQNPWLLFVTLAGLAWGTYVPLIFYGGSELGGKPSSRLLAILCVGIAYFVIAVIFPAVYLSMTPAEQQPRWGSVTGLAFSGLAGAAGAVGAICVIFATKSAIEAAKVEGRPPATYKLYIAPLIFGLAPVITTVVSVFWHPEEGNPFRFGVLVPHWTLWLGIVLVGSGAALVLYSKELTEASPAPAPPPGIPAEAKP
ncbi:MAG TPA: hypothetical protein VKD72_17015 [Gemmataceae bacterium]|nr:hypothetical protein [Gemmataceae bacterium]